MPSRLRVSRSALNGVILAIDRTNRLVKVQSTNAVVSVRIPTNALTMLPNHRIGLEDLRVGDRVGLVGRPGADGTTEAMTVRVGARPPGGGNVKRIDPGRKRTESELPVE